MLSPKTKSYISRIIPFGIIWLVLGWIFLFVEHAAVSDPDQFASTAIRLDLNVLIFASLAVALVGMIVGFIEVVYMDKRFKSLSFTRKIIYKIIIYGLFLNLIILITYPIAASIELKTGVLDPVIWNRYYEFLSSRTNFSTMVQMSISLIASLFYAEISDNIGHKVLINFFTGKYHNPVEENRIFMFLDMKSSTTIAEKLGHIKYFKLLKEYYADISEAVVTFGGEIYQYVGDEIIVSWQLKTGIKNNSCIRCFFAMKKDLQKQSEKYQKKYGIIPSFKAGLHFGEVTTGEIGIYKKDILFSGDVLNAAARIQALCNDFHVDILVSGELMKLIEAGDEFRIKSMGKKALRGKTEVLELYTIIKQ